MEIEKFKIRDLRKKEQYKIDDEYLNNYAKLVKPTATAVYNSLSRHAGFHTQESFPSEKLIAEEHGIEVRSVRRAIKKLKEYNIIKVKQVKNKKGNWLNNVYFLLDKTEWVKPKVKNVLREDGRSKLSETVGQNCSNKDTTNKDTKEYVAIATDKVNLLEELLLSKIRGIHIIGLWIKENGIELQNKDIRDSIIRRNVKIANLLKGYADKDIIETIKLLKETEYIKKFTLETVGKYIDEVIKNNKKVGKKVIGFEEIIRDDGVKAVRPIYEK